MNNKAELLVSLNKYLNNEVIDQTEAAHTVTQAVGSAEWEMNERSNKPRHTFLFMGPTGVGKTSMAKAFTKFLFNQDRLVMIFMNELQSANDVGRFAKMIEAGVKAHPGGCTFLLDEVEKCTRAIMDVLLSLLDEGQITMEDGRKVSISDCYVAMTSNIGSSEFSKMTIMKYVRIQKFAIKEAKEYFRPELMARIKSVVVFKPLKYESQLKIMNANLGAKLKHLADKFGDLVDGGQFAVDGIAHAHLMRRCFTQHEGARKLKDTLDHEINAALLESFGSGLMSDGVITYDPRTDRLTILK
jgi:ATP-dependent Clp protease ATP-binding subunit ClpB